MIGASTRNTAAMRTRMGRIIGTCGETDGSDETQSGVQNLSNHHKKKKICVTDAEWPVKLRLLDFEIDESRQSDGIKDPGCEADNSDAVTSQT